MSQNAAIKVDVQMLPPSFAVYMKGAVFIPVLIKAAPAPAPVEVYVAPVVLASNTRRIYWDLVLLSDDPGHLAEFDPPGPVSFTDPSDDVDVVPEFGFPRIMSTTQLMMSIEESKDSLSHTTFQYSLYFHLRKGPSGPLGPVIRAMVADPSVAITPDPVEIPTWP